MASSGGSVERSLPGETSDLNPPAVSSPMAAPSESLGNQSLGHASSLRTPQPHRSPQSGGWSHLSTPRNYTTPSTPIGTPGSHDTGRRATPAHRNDISGGLGHRTRRNRPGSQTPGRGAAADEPPPTGGTTQTRTGAGLSSEPGSLGDNLPHTYVWGTDVDVQDLKRRFIRFMKNFREDAEDFDGKYRRLLEEVVEREGNTFNIDCQNIHSYDPELYRLLVRYPLEVIPIFDLVVGDLAASVEPEYHIPILTRLFNLKDSVNMRDLNPSDIDQLVSIKGMVIRCSSIIPDIKFACFQCLVCQHIPEPIIVEKGRVAEPARCPNPECETRGSMSLIHNRSKFINKQVVRLQETPDAIPEGETPHTVSLCMFENLVDACKPGDRVEVTGVFRAQPVRVSTTQRNLRSLYKTYIDCIHIKKAAKGRLQAEDPQEANPEADTFAMFPEGDALPGDYTRMREKLLALSRQPDIYEKLSRSLAPSIWELDDIKKGLLCQLFGGASKKLSSGAQFRGDINVLLVGDPGTSKSQLLQYVHKIAPRGIYTSGRGSSAVGLTAYVSKDPETREMVLESGALVLSDKGICCIDEFDKMSENARSMLHEVMEQQTVSVAKAGIIASLNARTSVLACANPSGSRYNPRLSVIDNIQLPPTLLSRFDLIYLVLDKPDEQTDRRLARFLVGLHYEEPEMRAEAIIDPATLSQYISHARMHIHPRLSDDAAGDLVDAYTEMRGRGVGRKVITATPRQLESLIRVSEALARMRFSEVVERIDVAEAKRLLEVAMQQSATDPTTGTIDMDLITTGISASERTKRTQIMAAVKELLLDHLTPGGPHMRVPTLVEEMQKQTRMEVTNHDVREALLSLQGENFIFLRGDSVGMS